MADRKRWFKVWTTILFDMDHLPDDLLGKWLRLGCRAAAVGENGRVRFESPEHLARFLGVTVSELSRLRDTLPHVLFTPPEIDNGAITVTLENWYTDQMDSTAYERMRRLRAKRREEKEKEKSSTTPPPTSPKAAAPPDRPEGSLDPPRSAGNDPESIAQLLARRDELRRLRGYQP